MVITVTLVIRNNYCHDATLVDALKMYDINDNHNKDKNGNYLMVITSAVLSL